jgi:alanine dehydrogenase
MRIGVPTEVKNHEYRVGMTPAAVREAVHHGHEVIVQAGAGRGIGCDDGAYLLAGARIATDAAAVFDAAELVVKVKEPQPQECAMLRRGQTLFTYLHLAPDPVQAQGLLASGCTAIAYETITDDRGGLPLLAPMSEVAGRMAIQVGAVALQKAHGGLGVLLGGVPGVAPAQVCVIGGGVVGTHAARMAVGLGADVTILDRSLPRLRQIDEAFGGRIRTQYATLDATEAAVLQADLVASSSRSSTVWCSAACTRWWHWATRWSTASSTSSTSRMATVLMVGRAGQLDRRQRAGRQRPCRAG